MGLGGPAIDACLVPHRAPAPPHPRHMSSRHTCLRSPPSHAATAIKSPNPDVGAPHLLRFSPHPGHKPLSKTLIQVNFHQSVV